MVPPVERSAYMYELHNIAENIARERCELSEVQPPVQSVHECHDRKAEDQPVGLAFDIPMTQVPTLEELPSQLDFDWQDSASPKDAVAVQEATDLNPKPPEESAFVEVSQIAHEAVVHATQQEVEMETDGATTSTNVAT